MKAAIQYPARRVSLGLKKQPQALLAPAKACGYRLRLGGSILPG